MNIRPSQIKHKQRIASFITHAVVVVMGVLIVSVLFQSYQISSRLMAQEGQRTSVQTSSLIQSLFDFRLAALRIHQDSTAKNISLINALVSRDSSRLDAFFPVSMNLNSLMHRICGLFPVTTTSCGMMAAPPFTALPNKS